MADSIMAAENAALRSQVEWLRNRLDQAWDMCRVAQKVVRDLGNTGGLTKAGQVILQAAAVQDCIGRCPFYRGLDDWLDSVQSDVDEGDAVSIMAGDSNEFSEPESTLCEDNLHAGHSSLPVIDETPISMDRVVILDDGDLISNGDRISNDYDNDDRKDQDNDQNNGQDEECVAPSIWMRVDMPLENDVLVISDSLLKTIDENFIQWRRVEVYPFSGLRTRELLDILRRQHQRGVRADTLIICVGTNDYYRTSPTKVSTYLKKVIAVATTMSPDVVLFTVPDSHWKGKFGNLKSNRRNRRKINAAIQDLTSRSVRVFDLDHIFRGRRGMRHENGPGWYHKDSVHPNTKGIMAIELCLQQLLRGETILAPRDRDLCFTRAEAEQRRAIMCEFSVKCPRKPKTAPKVRS